MKKILFLLATLSLLWPNFTLAQESFSNFGEEIFEAQILEILAEKEITREDGSKNLQQNIKLIGLTGGWQNKKFNYQGISEIDVVSSNIYKKGDKVLISYNKNIDGSDTFYIIDYIRRSKLYLLALVFVIIIIVIGKTKGLRSLISLLVSFLIIMKFIIPMILAGHNPLFIGLVGSFFILLFIIYLTEGLNKKSHLAIFTILICLLLTGLLAILFTSLARLTGMSQEEIMFLIDSKAGFIDFKGLLLTAIIIGTLGVLDDIVISQIEAAQQLKKASPELGFKEIYKMTFEIGNAHLGAIINTLFLAYAGASLPLLLLFGLRETPFETYSQVINHEMIATEIVRTLVGNIGLILAVPLATFMASYFYCRKK